MNPPNQDWALPQGVSLRRALVQEAGRILVLQRCCWSQVAIQNNSLSVPALHESIEELRAWIQDWEVIVAEQDHRLIAAARGRKRGSKWEVGRIMVAPDWEGQGLGRWILAQCENLAPGECTSCFLYTAPGNARGIEIYKRAGYQEKQPDIGGTGHMQNALFLCKPLGGRGSHRGRPGNDAE